MPNAYDFGYEELFAGDTDVLHVYLEQVYTLRKRTSVDEFTLSLCYDLGLSTGAAMALSLYNSASPLSILSVDSNRKTSPEDLAEYSANIFWYDFPKVPDAPFGGQPAKKAFLQGWVDGYNGAPASLKMAEHLIRLRLKAEEQAQRRKTREKTEFSRQKIHALIDRMSEEQLQKIQDLDV